MSLIKAYTRASLDTLVMRLAKERASSIAGKKVKILDADWNLHVTAGVALLVVWYETKGGGPRKFFTVTLADTEPFNE